LLLLHLLRRRPTAGRDARHISTVHELMRI
jgi:hypothetical protein